MKIETNKETGFIPGNMVCLAIRFNKAVGSPLAGKKRKERLREVSP